ncbi:hypothetical protein AB0P21_28525 [Kribbella sp. NPDC056861]|uniref:hypothetical protein n=1 Tax=Kribbella sp. NPDC056861 TaxID=3154857 RepID=UPI003438C5B6
MSQPMDHRTITANEAWTEYVSTCNEIIEIEHVIVFLDDRIAQSLNRAEPVVAVSNSICAAFVTDAFWQLLDLFHEASKRCLALYAARDYTYAVWQSALTAREGNTGVDTYVSQTAGEAL